MKKTLCGQSAKGFNVKLYVFTVYRVKHFLQADSRSADQEICRIFNSRENYLIPLRCIQCCQLKSPSQML